MIQNGPPRDLAHLKIWPNLPMPQDFKDLNNIRYDLHIRKHGRVYWTELIFSQPQQIGVGQFLARPAAGDGFVHYTGIWKICKMHCMRNNVSLISGFLSCQKSQISAT